LIKSVVKTVIIIIYTISKVEGTGTGAEAEAEPGMIPSGQTMRGKKGKARRTMLRRAM